MAKRNKSSVLIASNLGRHERFVLPSCNQILPKGKLMPAYLIAEHIITDEAKFHEYRTKVEPMMAKHGGRYLTKGATHKLPEGGHWKPERVVIIEFPDINSLDAWYNSPEYQPLIALRKSCTSDQDMLFVLEGA
jgi:uncharacterized protein (DUF1330 family)